MSGSFADMQPVNKLNSEQNIKKICHERQQVLRLYQGQRLFLQSAAPEHKFDFYNAVVN